MLLGLMLAAPLDGIILLQTGYFFTNYQRLFQSLEAVTLSIILMFLHYFSDKLSTKVLVSQPEAVFITALIVTTGRINNSGGLGAFHLDDTVLV